jgi:hypothetical protein
VASGSGAFLHRIPLIASTLRTDRRRMQMPAAAEISHTLHHVADDDALDGVPELDRQTRPVVRDVQGRPLVPQRVPELAPTPLQNAFIYLSVVVLICGVIAIMALELGVAMSSLLVKVPVLIGGTLLLLVTADALVRVWRSIGAWREVDPGRAWFRVVWVVVLAASLIVEGAIVVVVLMA